MIRAVFRERADALVGFEIRGHAGYAEAGRDIVCAAVSSAAYLTANCVTDTFGVRADANEANGVLTLTLREDSDIASGLIKGLRAHLEALAEQYPDCIKIITEV